MTDANPTKRLNTAHTSRARRFADRGARWLVSAGGLAIIASILGILVFIVVEVGPLFRQARVEPHGAVAIAGAPLGAALADEYRSMWLGLGTDGKLRSGKLPAGGAVEEIAIPGLAPRPLHAVQVLPNGKGFAAATDDGGLLAFTAGFEVGFVRGARTVTPRVGRAVVAEIDPKKTPVSVFAATLDADGRGAFAAPAGDGAIALAKFTLETNEMTGEGTETWDRRTLGAPAPVECLLIDHDAGHLLGGTAKGDLLRWDLRKAGSPVKVHSGGSAPITALGFLVGERSVVVGRADGSLGIWFAVPTKGDEPQFSHIRDFPRLPSAIRGIAAARRNKGFAAHDSAGNLGLYYSTSERVLWTGTSPIPNARSLVFCAKGDGLLLAGERELAMVDLDNPHPEFGFTAIFGKVWYEDLEEPTQTWSSTGGTDDHEAQLSLTPLLFGTLKGTLYSLLLAIPIAVLAAMYTSQFLHPSLRRIVKPIVEIMASLPSVVLGFLAALWLAPRLEKWFPALILMLAFLPFSILVAGWTSRLVPREVRHKFPEGTEVFAYIGVLALGFVAALAMAQPFEAAIFGGNFPAWLLETTGLEYWQRNAIVVGIAMGFAVIPIIFAIAEDAFSNVPRSLVSASLALGANRWQTVTRVVLPSASPGIFSGIMVGFGRAVGETMIVLLAAGNTAIMALSPFNGFRTLSANIATEIPEAVPGSTQFRTLFLAGLLLFLVTFVVNTVAEVVRQRLRSKYSTL